MCISVKAKKQTSFKRMMEIMKKWCIIGLRCYIIFLHRIFDCAIDFIFGFYYNDKVKELPPIDNELLLDSAVVLAKKIRTKQVTVEKVVSTFIDRCKIVNGTINAIVEERYNDAIEEAKALDRRLAEMKNCEDLKNTLPFFGVPFTTKESNEAKGMLHTMGLSNRKNHCSDEDSTVVHYVKQAGGILIAKTNIPELNLWVESRNHVYGQSNNPYNTTRTVGGSSGGEGAIIAACGSAISIGSDIGGSTRLPAFVNGVFGFKPTEGLTPTKGIGLRQKDYPHSMVEAGPICKKAEDIAPFLKVLTFKTGDEIAKLKLDVPVDLKTLNVYYQEDSGDLRASTVNKTMRTALQKTVQHFEGITGSATKIKIPGTEYTYRLWRFWMSQEEADFKSDITNKKYRANAVSEISKLIMGRCELTLAAVVKLIDEDIFPKDNSDWAKPVTANMKKFLLDTLEENGILFYPSAPFPAMYHYSSFLRPYNFSYFCLFNVLKLPVCQVPLGLSEEGLPIGVQVVAAPYNDHLCIAVARELERRFGGWVPPS